MFAVGGVVLWPRNKLSLELASRRLPKFRIEPLRSIPYNLGMEAPEYEILIRESHLDTFGHVNNATYLTLFEEARWEIVSKRGFSLDDIKRTGLGPTLLEVNVKWKREVRNRERIRIRTKVTGASGKVQQLQQVMVNEKDEEVCIAEYVVALFDVKARKLVPPTPEWKAAIGIPD